MLDHFLRRHKLHVVFQRREGNADLARRLLRVEAVLDAIVDKCDETCRDNDTAGLLECPEDNWHENTYSATSVSASRTL